MPYIETVTAWVVFVTTIFFLVAPFVWLAANSLVQSKYKERRNRLDKEELVTRFLLDVEVQTFDSPATRDEERDEARYRIIPYRQRIEEIHRERRELYVKWVQATEKSFFLSDKVTRRTIAEGRTVLFGEARLSSGAATRGVVRLGGESKFNQLLVGAGYVFSFGQMPRVEPMVWSIEDELHEARLELERAGMISDSRGDDRG